MRRRCSRTKRSRHWYTRDSKSHPNTTQHFASSSSRSPSCFRPYISLSSCFRPVAISLRTGRRREVSVAAALGTDTSHVTHSQLRSVFSTYVNDQPKNSNRRSTTKVLVCVGGVRVTEADAAESRRGRIAAAHPRATLRSFRFVSIRFVRVEDATHPSRTIDIASHRSCTHARMHARRAPDNNSRWWRRWRCSPSASGGSPTTSSASSTSPVRFAGIDTFYLVWFFLFFFGLAITFVVFLGLKRLAQVRH
jgi:hypothetical protein